MNKLFKGLPLYEATINDNDETGMEVISLVADPAIEVNFLVFEGQKEILKYSIENEEQRMVFGAVMLADMPIYRRTPSGEEFYITYSAKTIRKMAEKYFKLGYQNNVDTDHNFKLEEGVTMVQMFIKDTENGISPKGFEDAKDGSLFAQFHVENDEVWNAIKDGTYLGFSLTGCFQIDEIEFSKQNNNKIKNNVMSKISKLKAMLQTILAEFAQVSTDKGILSWASEGEMPEVGEAVMLIDEEGQESVPEDGEYVLAEGDVIVVAEGRVAEIRPAERPESEEPAAEDVEAACDKKKKTCCEGEEPVAEPVVEPVVEPVEPAPVDESGNVEDEKDSLIAELKAQIAALEAKCAGLEAENKELLAKIEELAAEPAAEPAEEQFEKVNKLPKTGNKQLDNLARIINAK